MPMAHSGIHLSHVHGPASGPLRKPVGLCLVRPEKFRPGALVGVNQNPGGESLVHSAQCGRWLVFPGLPCARVASRLAQPSVWAAPHPLEAPTLVGHPLGIHRSGSASRLGASLSRIFKDLRLTTGYRIPFIKGSMQKLPQNKNLCTAAAK